MIETVCYLQATASNASLRESVMSTKTLLLMFCATSDRSLAPHRPTCTKGLSEHIALRFFPRRHYG